MSQTLFQHQNVRKRTFSQLFHHPDALQLLWMKAAWPQVDVRFLNCLAERLVDKPGN